MPSEYKQSKEVVNDLIDNIIKGSYAEGFSKGYDKGFEEGAAKQAILELRGRDKFLAELRQEQDKKGVK